MTTLLDNIPLSEPKAFRQHLNSVPLTFQIIKERAWERYKNIPRPSRKDELWRYSNLSGYHPESNGIGFLENHKTEFDFDTKRFKCLKNYSDEIIFFDGANFSQSTHSGEKQETGVVFMCIAEAMEKHPDRLIPLLKKSIPDLGSKKFSALHQAYFQNGIYFHVPPEVSLEKPFVAYHWFSRTNCTQFPFTIIDISENAKAQFIDFYLTADDDDNLSEGSPFVINKTLIHAGAGSKVSTYSVQSLSPKSQYMQLVNSEAERDSHLQSTSVHLGTAKARQENHIALKGSGAQVHSFSLTVATGKQEFDQRTFQSHQAEHTYSNLLYKNALFENARTIFSGLIHVKPQGQHTDAYQTNRNLLLNPEAEAISMPGLEIGANEVKCSHGATTGQIDESELFYMLSRGIPPAKAKELLVFGFFEEIISKIEDPSLQELLRILILEKFSNKSYL